MRVRMTTFYGCVHSFLRFVFRAFLGMRVLGREYFPTEGRVIVAVNHVSGYDPVIVGVALSRELHFLAKEELFRLPLVGNLIRKLHAIPIRRQAGDRGAIRTAFQVLQQERPLLMFPEGTRSRTGQFQAAKGGVGMLALKSGSRVVPVYLSGTFRLFYNLLRRRVTVTFGRPMEIGGFRSLRLPMKEIYRRIGQETMERIKELRHVCHD